MFTNIDCQEVCTQLKLHITESFHCMCVKYGDLFRLRAEMLVDAMPWRNRAIVASNIAVL